MTARQSAIKTCEDAVTAARGLSMYHTAHGRHAQAAEYAAKATHNAMVLATLIRSTEPEQIHCSPGLEAFRK